MAISRSQISRQLQNRGGITNISPRQNFGLGSKLKRFVRKVIPNEVSKVASAAAPFVAPFNPALAAGMAGIGSFDQTGSIGDALKRGALTYGGGQAARYIGGAGFQGNPFQGDVLGNFTSFSSPIGTETGLGKFFSKPGAPIQEVKPLGYEASEMEIIGSNIPAASEMEIVGSNIPVAGKTTFTESLKKIVSPDTTLTEKGGEALNLLKRGGKALFTKKDAKGNDVLDKAVLFGTLGFATSYAEAKKLANDVGVDITESEYDEARKAEKKEEYATNLQNFFAGKKDGGRIGFAEGSEDSIMSKLMVIPNMMDKIGKKVAPLLGYDNSGIDMIALEKEVRENPEMVNELTDIEFGVAEPGKPVSPESTIFMRFDKEKEEADMLQELLRELEADGGRIGYASGSMSDKKYAAFMNQVKLLMANGMAEEDAMLSAAESIYMGKGFADGGRIGLREGTGGKKKYGKGIESAVKQIDPLQEGLGELKMGGGGGLPLAFTRLEKSFLFKHLAKLGGADRSFTMPQLYRILSDPSKYPKDAVALKEFLKIKGFSKGGDVGAVNEIPVRTNKAGVKELDMRSTGGFVPIGVKEKADDVPAMLSKNEFVLTADAVRGIGGGSVEKGSEKLYNVMKQAEKIGKA